MSKAGTSADGPQGWAHFATSAHKHMDSRREDLEAANAHAPQTQETQNCRRSRHDLRLVLHFDINKTILKSDKAQGSNLDAVLNSLLADRAWGRVDAGPHWRPVGRLSIDKPANDPELMTYSTYVDKYLSPDAAASVQEAAERSSLMKQQRRHQKRTFTESNEPGEMFRGVYDHLKQALMLPPEVAATTQGMPLFEGGRRHILTSFFNLLLHLNKQEEQCMVVFRTFGVDIPEVAGEMDLFASGKHPCYPEVCMDRRNGSMDMRISDPESFGVFSRVSGKPHGSRLLLGAPQLVGCKDISKAQFSSAADKAALAAPSSFTSIHSTLMKLLDDEKSALALRDCYEYWSACGECSSAGKLLLLDPDDSSTLQIFFDDNIEVSDAHIVDVRDVTSGDSIAFEDAIGRHLRKVDPLQAILDPLYYVRAVHDCMRVFRSVKDVS
ncbi:hypothetical protein WJX73_003405 [Symbiochloris irregularis]|uniref:Uncharacterized protein n=1 Tax=Symbiochloris irregularis TaxID=706552 RepID=A0AAW1PNC6_9CHLO